MLKRGGERAKLSRTMKIAKDTVVAFDYTLTDGNGKVLDASAERAPLEYLHGAGNIISGLEKALEGLAAGDRKRVEVAPEEGYGVVDPALVITVPRKSIEFAGTIEKGMRFHAQDGNGGVVAFTVAELLDGGEKIKLDGNHPLAGVTLFFDVEIKSVRAATVQEIYAKRPDVPACSCGGHGHGECCGHGDCCCGEC